MTLWLNSRKTIVEVNVMVKILVSDKYAQEGIDILTSHGGFQVDIKTGKRTVIGKCQRPVESGLFTA